MTFAAQASIPNIFVIGDAVAPTGFARVVRSILEPLRSTYEFHQLGVNYRGDPHDWPWSVYPAGLHGDDRGFNRVAALMTRIKPQLVFMNGDLWQLMQYAGVLARIPDPVPVVAYFPVESDPVEPRAVVPLLRRVAHLVTYTAFGARETETGIARARQAHPDLPERPLSVIGHGVDGGTFFPLRDLDSGDGLEHRRIARRALFPGRRDLEDAFIVLNANRNQPRKRIDVTLEAFALFAAGKPENVKLYLHMARQDVGWDIFCLAERLGILDRLLVTRSDNEYCDEPSERLNLIYNACEVGVNTASAEGWGLVSFEHAATGAAQIVPRHTALAELWEGAAELVEPSFSLTTEQTLTRSYFVSPRDVAAAMERLYADPPRRHELARAARRLASRREMSWVELSGRWDRLFRGLIDGRPERSI